MPRHFFIIVLLLAIAGCKRESSGNAASGKQNEAVAFAPLVFTNSAEADEAKDIEAKANEALMKKNYAGLESVADDYRSGKDCFPNGIPKLYCVYSGLSELDEKAEDAGWTERVKALAQWVKAKPDSVTARVALASTWINYAWKARGHDYADKVSDDSFKLFGQRTLAAHAVLEQASKLPSKCPMYWSCMQRIALNEGWSKPDYEKMFNEAIQTNPGFYNYYSSKINYLLPRWYGNEGDWEAFAQSAADKLGGDEGDMQYARMIWNTTALRIYGKIYEETKISWKRTKRGFELLHKRYPESLAVTSAYCMHAGMNKDKAKMKELFTELGGQVDLPIWIQKERFEAFRDWAFDK